MKKALVITLSFVLLFSCCGCGFSNSSVDSSLFNVSVTIPGGFFEDQSPEEALAEAKAAGRKAELNSDGSITYTMSKKEQQQMLAEMSSSVDESLKEFIADGNNSFTKIEHNDAMSEFFVYCSPNTYTDWDCLYSLGFYLYGAYYQLFAGIENEKIDVAVKYLNDSTNEVLNTASYKDYIAGGAN